LFHKDNFDLWQTKASDRRNQSANCLHLGTGIIGLIGDAR
jgi:hypothetical protein